MIKITSGAKPKIERKSVQQSISNEYSRSEKEMQEIDARVRKNFSIPEEAQRVVTDRRYFGATLFEWVWYETRFPE